MAPFTKTLRFRRKSKGRLALSMSKIQLEFSLDTCFLVSSAPKENPKFTCIKILFPVVNDPQSSDVSVYQKWLQSFLQLEPCKLFGSIKSYGPATTCKILSSPFISPAWKQGGLPKGLNCQGASGGYFKVKVR